MAAHIRNPDATKYNISKKIAQLTKVITALEDQCMHYSLYLTALHERQARATDRLLHAYHTNVSRLSARIGSADRRAVDHAHSFWEARISDEYDTFVTFLEMAGLDHTQKLEEIRIEQSVIPVIADEVEAQAVKVEREVAQWAVDIAERVREAEELQKVEIARLDQESELREEEVRRKAEMRIEEMSERQKWAKENVEVKEERVEIDCEVCRVRLESLRREAGSLKGELREEGKEAVRIVIEGRKAAGEVQRLHRRGSDSKAWEWSEFDSRRRKAEGDMECELRAVIGAKKKARESQGRDIRELQEKYKRLVRDNNSEMEERLDDAARKVLHQLLAVQGEARARILGLEEQARERIRELEDRLSEMRASDEAAKLAAERVSLEHERYFLVQRHAEELQALEIEEARELSSLEDALKNEKEAYEEVERNSVAALERSHRTDRCNLQLRHADEQTSCARACQDAASANLSFARESILAEGDSWVKPFDNTWTTLKEELLRPDDPPVDILPSLDRAVQELESEKRERLCSIASEREEIQILWEQRMTEENDRLSSCSTRPRSQIAKNHHLQALESAIETIRQETQANLTVHQESLAGIEASHEAEMDRLQDLRWEAEMADDESMFRLELQAAQAEFDALSLLMPGAISDLEWECQVSGPQPELYRWHEEVTEASSVSLKKDGELQAEINPRSAQLQEMRIARLRHDIAHEHDTLARLEQSVIRETQRQIARNDYEIVEQQKKQRAARNDEDARFDAIFGFYDERLSVLRATLDELKRRCNNPPSRQCEIDLIEKLTLDLRALTLTLRSLATGRDSSRSVNVESEWLSIARLDGPSVAELARSRSLP
jgi:hypothetical protein